MTSDTKQMKMTSVDVLAEETLYSGFYTVKRLTIQHQRFEGGVTPPLQRELVLRREAAGCLLYDPSADAVVLIQQFRVGALGDQDSPWLYEIVAGLVEANENIAELIIRETKEEANLDVNNLKFITKYYPSPGGSNEMLSVFVGQVDSAKAGGVYGLAEEGEDIRVVVLPRLAAMAMVENGEIRNAATIIAMQWLVLNRESLVLEWQDGD